MSMVTKFVIWSTLLLVLVGITGYRSMWNNQNASTQDFNYWQNQYKDIAYQLTTDQATKEAIRATGNEVKQVTVLQFSLLKQDGTTQQRVDRCQSCHIGLLDPNMTAEKIIKTVDHQDVATADVADYLEKHPETRKLVLTIGAHPGIEIETTKPFTNLGVVHSPTLQYGVTTNASVTDADKADYNEQKVSLKRHPFATFGCTVCHNGSGRELIEEKAHGEPEHWLQPLLPAKFMESACAQCHATYNEKTYKISYLPSMTTIARGEKLFKDKACYGCHKIEGFSKGNIGPELTYEGRQTTFAAIQHQLWDPRYKVGSCVMPFFFAAQDLNPVKTKGTMKDPRIQTVEPAEIDEPIMVDGKLEETENSKAIKESLRIHGYVPDKAAQEDVDALVTFVYSQTGQNYASSQSSRFTAVAAYNVSAPEDVPITVAEGKKLFETSGCYSCHYVGDPNNPKAKGKGGVAGPELTWEGSRHSTEWLVEHYKNPQAFVPGSIMPIFPFSDSQRQALSLYDQSFKTNKPGARPVSADQDMPSAAMQKAGAANRDIRYMTR